MNELRVLVVDDEPGIRKAVARVLRDFKVTLPDVEGEVRFVIDEAESGERALELIEMKLPHIMLLDLKLPGISGLDVLERLSQKNLSVLTIMITAYASLETAVRTTKEGAYDFLAKPFTPTELENTVFKAAKHAILKERARELAEEKRQVRFQFISVLAHELKAPINAVEGYLQIIKSKSAGEDPEVYEQMVERSLVRIQFMRKMIIDLLDLTRIESGKKKRELSRVDVRAIADMTLETVAPDAEARGITLNLNCDQSVVMCADGGEIEIILNNLITNAIKYNRDQGRVDVVVTKAEGVMTIRVSDTGIGMSEEEVSRLFGTFVRIKNEKTHGILGSGLGLSIIEKIADLYSGKVVVTSVPEEGSTFTVTLMEQTAKECEI